MLQWLGCFAAPIAHASAAALPPSGQRSEPAPGEVHVTPYLAAAKARAFSRAVSRARTASPAQDAYDAKYYSLDLTIDPAQQLLEGVVRMSATVTAGPLSTLELDLESGGLTVDGVTRDGLALPFTHASDRLDISLDRPFDGGETIDVVIRYHGTPIPGGFGSFTFDSHLGYPLVWTLSEPFGARAWWPCKDQPADKADSVDVRVCVPSGMRTASNGTCVLDTDDGIHATTAWHERHPIAPYLVAVTSFPYYTYSDWFRPTPSDSMEIRFWVYLENFGVHADDNAHVKDMLAAESAQFGPYPFLDEKYGHVEFPFGGGMEHQTCTSLGSWSPYIEAHELGHQWWGDWVTCRDFHHIWLNEGFATYAEALWAESQGGAAAYHDNMSYKRYFGPGTIYVPDLSQVERIFDGGLSYDKGSWVLHMLRHALGDSLFFTALRDYGRQHAYGTAITEDLQQAFEATSGIPLKAFFQEWIYGEGFPQYEASVASGPGVTAGYHATVELTQTQAGTPFWMPVDLELRSASGTQRFRVIDSLAVQKFEFHYPDSVTAVVVDPDEWILRQVRYTVGGPIGLPGDDVLALIAPRPNPTSSGSRVLLAVRQGGVTRVTVLDALGRRVKTLYDGPLVVGRHPFEWDGTDAVGRARGSGIYWICAEEGSHRSAQKLVLLR
jgi:aminopeptidase N